MNQVDIFNVVVKVNSIIEDNETQEECEMGLTKYFAVAPLPYMCAISYCGDSVWNDDNDERKCWDDEEGEVVYEDLTLYLLKLASLITRGGQRAYLQHLGDLNDEYE